MSKFIKLNQILNPGSLKQNQEEKEIYVNIDNISSFRTEKNRLQSIVVMNQCHLPEIYVSESVEDILSKIQE